MSKHIPLKWGDEKSKYFSKPIPRVERVSWFDRIFDGIEEWFIWAVIILMGIATVWIGIKIYQLSLIRIWLKSI